MITKMVLLRRGADGWEYLPEGKDPSKASAWKRVLDDKFEGEPPEPFDGEQPAVAVMGPQGLHAFRLLSEAGKVDLAPPAVAAATGADFHNPYSFVPLAARPTKGPLADGRPVDHGAYVADHYYGTLGVTITTATPLVIPDMPAAAWRDGHATVPLLTGPDGRPDLPPTTLKGVLRSAFEAVTSSRFGVFRGHDEPLGYRPPARDGASVVPARVQVRDGVVTGLNLYPGSEAIGFDRGHVRVPQTMFAAWVDRRRQLPEHGTRVAFRASREQHRTGRFSFWRVDDLRVLAPGEQPGAGEAEGWVHRTGSNAQRKHWERVFFTATADGDRLAPRRPQTITLGGEDGQRLFRRWRRMVAEAKDVNKRALARKAPGPQPNVDFSPHMLDATWSELHDGATCFARLGQRNGDIVVVDLQPVQISRRLPHHSPRDFLDDSFFPVGHELAEHSPADRVFGSTTSAGLVRLGNVTCTTPATEAVEDLGASGVPLAILSSPKPTQARFYLGRRKGRGPTADALPAGIAKDQAAYHDPHTQALRGRKVYVHHHGLPDDHWAKDGADREFRRASGSDAPERDDQNRSITAWVRPGTRFEVDVRIDGLSEVELGALVWLLDLDAHEGDGHHLRAGFGKPLGFGSLKLVLDPQRTQVATGAEIADGYRTLQGRPRGDIDLQAVVSAFKQQLEADGLTEPARAFLRAAKGHQTGLPVHYPRQVAKPSADHPSYEWFVENERASRDHPLPGRPLPDLLSDGGLPRQGGEAAGDGRGSGSKGRSPGRGADDRRGARGGRGNRR